MLPPTSAFISVPLAAAGITVERSRSTRWVVALSAGPWVEMALKNAVVPALSICIGVTAATPEVAETSFCSVCRRGSVVARIAPVRRARAAAGSGLGGGAEGHRDDQRAVGPRPEVLRRAGHRPGGRWWRSTVRRCPAGRGSARTAGSSTGSGSSARSAPRSAALGDVGRPPRPQPGPRPARRSAGLRTRNELIRGPRMARNAGSRVSAPRTATTTATAAIRPIVVTSGISATASETSAIVTVPPAKNTAPPEVAVARAIDSWHRRARRAGRGSGG